MAQSSAEMFLLASRYAKATLAVMAEKKASVAILTKVKDELQQLADIYKNSSALQRLALLASEKESVAAMGDLSKKMKLHSETAKLLKVVAHNRRLTLLPHLAEVFARQLSEHKGELIVKVTTANPLTDAAKKKISNAFAKQAKGGVVIESEEDPAILGGAIIRAGSRMLDASVKGRLDRLKNELKTA